MSDVLNQVTAIVVDKLGVDAGQVTSEASLTNDLGADSLAVADLIIEFEDKFGISIPDEDAQSISTVGDIVSYVQSKL